MRMLWRTRDVIGFANVAFFPLRSVKVILFPHTPSFFF
jgi:hypothetical protein